MKGVKKNEKAFAAMQVAANEKLTTKINDLILQLAAANKKEKKRILQEIYNLYDTKKFITELVYIK